MASQNSQIPRICGSCSKRHSPSELCYTPLRCWNCEEPPKYIDWNTFLIAKTDLSQVKSEQLRSAAVAIQNDQYTAVLCAESPDSPYAQNGTEKVAVFLHIPGGDKRLSFTKLGPGDISASSRKWEEIKFADWTMFKDILGVTSLPSNFPTPENICLLTPDELDTDVRGFDVGGPCTE
ncbi:uncharacterized protein EAE97_001079 [Botrytis byssoidea]|uniref:Uncharacterized protein n=1 Tax=Botrytis byssoidea TaxID=139641 RepID=A0A9P5M8B2_9HELO|nr:uncharacterized protein EAE97_001079 [Botrytis byssoidea]KAF7953680.1 hypothetical protein EAE97_001079 [Botrytis byssoidea]